MKKQSWYVRIVTDDRSPDHSPARPLRHEEWDTEAEAQVVADEFNAHHPDGLQKAVVAEMEDWQIGMWRPIA